MGTEIAQAVRVNVATHDLRDLTQPIVTLLPLAIARDSISQRRTMTSETSLQGHQKMPDITCRLKTQNNGDGDVRRRQHHLLSTDVNNVQWLRDGRRAMENGE